MTMNSMIKRSIVLVTLLQLLFGSVALAEPATHRVTFLIPNISCVSCEIRISQALNEVEGVLEVHFDTEARTVTVRYDERTDIDALKSATAAIGYPATVLTEGG
jgi:copper chaperone CopZ